MKYQAVTLGWTGILSRETGNTLVTSSLDAHVIRGSMRMNCLTQKHNILTLNMIYLIPIMLECSVINHYSSNLQLLLLLTLKLWNIDLCALTVLNKSFIKYFTDHLAVYCPVLL